MAGVELRAAREASGLSIRELAERAGVAASTVWRIESGRLDPTVGMLRRLLEAAWSTSVSARSRREAVVSLALGRRTAAEVLLDPDDRLPRARARVAAVLADEGSPPGARLWAAEWQHILNGPLEGVVAALIDPGQRGHELRQNTPFTGVRTDDERRFGLRENPSVTIRPAAAGDAVPIASILNAFVSTTTIEWADTPHTADSIREWLDEHETVLVAEERGEVVGIAAFGWFRDVGKRPGYRFTVENTIHVREDRWRSGVGRELMRALVDEARASGKHVMVAAMDSASEASIRFHERLGFVEVARMPEVGAKFGRWLDLVLLQLRLDDRSAPDDG